MHVYFVMKILCIGPHRVLLCSITGSAVSLAVQYHWQCSITGSAVSLAVQYHWQCTLTISTIGKCILCGENTYIGPASFVQRDWQCRTINLQSTQPECLQVGCQSALPATLHKTILCGQMWSIFTTEYAFSYCVVFSLQLAANLKSTIIRLKCTLFTMECLIDFLPSPSLLSYTPERVMICLSTEHASSITLNSQIQN